MKKKIFSKAFAIIGGLFVSLVLAVAPAKAVFIFATAASDGTPTASISVADGIETPDLGSDLNVQGNNWLNQKVSLSGEALENNSTFHWTSTASSNASGNADIDDAGDGDVVKVGYLTSSTTVVSGYATANDGSKWPSAYASKTVNALAPENGLSATYTATSHYHIGQTIKFTLMETVLSSEITMAENLFSTTWIGSDVNGDQATIWGAEAAFYWGTSSSGTMPIGNDLGWGMTEGSYTHTSGSAVWSRQLPEPIFCTQTYYLRGAVYDNYTGLCSEWKTLATITQDGRGTQNVSTFGRMAPTSPVSSTSTTTVYIGSSSLLSSSTGAAKYGSGGQITFFVGLYNAANSFPSLSSAKWGSYTNFSISSSQSLYDGEYYCKTYKIMMAGMTGGRYTLALTFSGTFSYSGFFAVGTTEQATIKLSATEFRDNFSSALETSSSASYTPHHVIETALVAPVLSKTMGTNRATYSATLVNVCGDTVLYYYYSTQSGAPEKPSSFAAGSQGSWTRMTTTSSFVISNTSGVSQTYYVYAFAACPTTGVSTSISSDSVTITATVLGASITAGTTTYTNASTATIALPAVYSGTTIRNTSGSGTLHYYVSTSSTAPAVGSSLYSSTSSTSITVGGETGTTADQTKYVYAYVTNASGTASAISTLLITIKASVAAPSCTHTHAWNSWFFQWRADSTWRNNSVYNLEKMRIVTQGNAEYDWSYGGMYCTNIAKDETFVPGTSAIGQNAAIESIGQGGGGTFGFNSFCQITYAGVTSKWYQTYCEHDTEINSPTTNFTSSDSITATYGFYYNFTISGSVYTTTTSYNG